MFAAILRALSRLSNFSDAKFSTKLFSEITSRRQIRKAPPIVDLTFSNDSLSVPRLNMSQLMKVDYSAVQLDI
jgi:hypothetical protein